jgi:hypothetical protein
LPPSRLPQNQAGLWKKWKFGENIHIPSFRKKPEYRCDHRHFPKVVPDGIMVCGWLANTQMAVDVKVWHIASSNFQELVFPPSRSLQIQEARWNKYSSLFISFF